MAREALAAWAPLLRCPHCGGTLALAEAVARCAAGHAFDVAASGHLTLARTELPAGDDPAMVAARAAFLARGWFAPITDALVAVARAQSARNVVEAGAGTAHHLAAVVAATGALGLALDASRPALRRAARAHPRIAAVGCDVWQPLPLADAAADLALVVFAPRNPAELARVLAPGGAVAVVTPGEGHLHELREPLDLLAVEPGKRERLLREFEPYLRHERGSPIEFALGLSRADVQALAAMGPSAHHVAPEDLAARAAALPEPFAVTASVRLDVFV